MKRKTIKDLPITGLISSYNPTWALLETVESMFKGGASVVIVVDDGSPKPDAAAIFEAVEALGAKVIHPGKNVGKASALKSGFHMCRLVQLSLKAMTTPWSVTC